MLTAQVDTALNHADVLLTTSRVPRCDPVQINTAYLTLAHSDRVLWLREPMRMGSSTDSLAACPRCARTGKRSSCPRNNQRCRLANQPLQSCLPLSTTVALFASPHIPDTISGRRQTNCLCVCNVPLRSPMAVTASLCVPLCVAGLHKLPHHFTRPCLFTAAATRVPLGIVESKQCQPRTAIKGCTRWRTHSIVPSAHQVHDSYDSCLCSESQAGVP